MIIFINIKADFCQQCNIYNNNINYRMLNISQILVRVLQNSPAKREQSIKNMSTKIMNSLSQLDELEKDKKMSEEKHLLEAFFKVLQKIANQLFQARTKYQSIDKQKLKQQKCLQLAKDIGIFKEECFYLRKSVIEAKKQLRKIKIQNQILLEQQGLLNQTCVKRQKQKNKIKSRTLSQFRTKQNNQTDKDSNTNVSSCIDGRKTFFRFRQSLDVSQYKNVTKRQILTSQKQRKHGASLDIKNTRSSKKTFWKIGLQIKAGSDLQKL